MRILLRYNKLLLPALLVLVIILLAPAAWAVTPQIRTGVEHTVQLRSDGTIWTSGANYAGQLGDGTTVGRSTPVQVGLLSNTTNWTAVAAGDDHTLALKADGSLWVWGANQSGQLGDGLLVNRIAPVRIGTSGDWTAVAAGGSSSFALKADGSLYAWGDNTNGRLGDGTIISKKTPTAISAVNNLKAVSAGEFHTLALKADGSLWAWGENTKGQIGDGSTTNRNLPVRIGNTSDWTTVAAGGSSSFALKADGTLWAWGLSDYGQLGIGVTDATAHSTPVKITAERDWLALSAGNLHVLAVKRNGTLWAWGDNTSGQLGDGTKTSRNLPQQITFPAGPTEIVTVAAGAFHSVALKANGEFFAWGYNGSGQLGNGSNLGSSSALLAGTDEISWVATEPGGEFTVARRSNGTLWTWGDNSKGQLGDNTITRRATPAMVGAATSWVAQAAGWSHTVALQADSTLWTWGGNSKGQLGDGTTTNRQIPAQIGAANNWRAVAAGDFHTLALKADGTLWTWGDNTKGQLGDGTAIPIKNSLVPIQIKTGYPGNFDKRWVAIAAGGSHSLALQADGTIWAWGDNTKGQRGNPDFGASINKPRQIAIRSNPPTAGFNSNWVSIATGLNHSLALQADGTLWAWGDNFSGQLGDGSAAPNSQIPVQVLNSGTSPYTAISAGDSNSFARKADGTLWAWGNNTSDQLGTGPHPTDVNPMIPVPHPTPARESNLAINWVAAASGGNHTVALKADGTLWKWGKNSKGELGDGTTANKNIPAPLVETHIEAAPTVIAFGPLAIGAPSSQAIAISNSGTAKLTVNSVSSNSADFIVTPGSCGSISTISLKAAASCTVNVAFNPSTAGAKNAILTIISGDPLFPTLTVALSGTAVVPWSVVTSVLPPGSGTITPHGTTGTVLVLPGSGQQFSITPNTGYQVLDVNVNGASKGPVSSLVLPPVTGNVTITATFAVSTYTITTNPGVNGTITGPATAKHDDLPIYTITPSPNYHVVDVTVDGKSIGAFTAVSLPSLIADTKITATFAINNYIVTMNAGVGGGVITGPVMVKHGDAATYAIAPNPGYHISDVKVNGVSMGPITAVALPPVTANAEITALFSNTYSVTVESDARGSVSPSGKATVINGFYFIFTPLAGYNVVNVLIDGVPQGSLPNYAFSDVAGDGHTVKVVFIPDGDLNNDGNVDIKDALRALKITVGLVSPTTSDILHGDTAPPDAGGIPVPDRKISVADALQILRKVVGLTSGW